MKQLTGLDFNFLLMETENNYGHVNGLSIYDRPSADFDPFAVVRERLNIMAGHLEPLRRKLVTVPFELDRPYWIEDADFDIDFHVRHLGLAPPGAADQLAEQVARIVGRRMDRTRPLWEAYVIEGLADGRWALLQKTHHATIDGAAGVIMLKMLTDDARDAEWTLEARPWEGEAVPHSSQLLQTAVKNLATNPVRGMRLSLNVVRSLAESAGVTSLSGAASQARDALGSVATRADPGRSGGDPGVRLPITPAPPTPWNKSVTPHRRFAMRSASVANLKQLKNATGGTLNDVVMAICTGALREYLLEKEQLPDGPLRAMVPVSIRTGNEEDPWTNRVSAIVADLPTNCADPLERVSLCRDAMLAAKGQLDLVPADTLGQASDYTSPVVAAGAVRLVSRLKLADRVNTPVNVVISNVPGPQMPLFAKGAEMEHFYPVSTITNTQGMNITVHSYEDRLDFGLISDRELVPDLWHLVDLHIEEISRLFEATGAEWAVPPAPKLMRYGGDGVEPVPPSDEFVSEMIAARHALEAESMRRGSTSRQRSAAKTSTKKASGTKRSTKKASAKKASAKKRTKKT